MPTQCTFSLQHTVMQYLLPIDVVLQDLLHNIIG